MSVPATEKQLAYIRSFGVQFQEGITKAQATELLSKLVNDPVALKKQAEINARQEEQTREYFSYCQKIEILALKKDLENLAFLPVKLKKKIEAANVEIKGLKDEIALANQQIDDIRDEIEDLKSEIKDIPDEAKSKKEELKEAEDERFIFWLYSIKEDVMAEAHEICCQLYEKFGKRFKVPSKKIIQEILEELDNEDLEWDKRDKGEFFRRLERRHPELIRK